MIVGEPRKEASSMAIGLLSPLLSSVGKLVDLLRSRSAASCPSRGWRSTVLADLQRLERLLRRIHATLDDAGDREVRDSSVKLWIEELTHLALDAENVLEDHRYELLRRLVQERQRAAEATSTSGKRRHEDEDGGFCEKIRKITRRFEISSDRSFLQLKPDDEDGGISEKIGEITRRFEEISTDRAALHLGPEDGVRIAGRDYLRESRVTSHLLDEAIVFGRTEEKESIIEFVLSCSQGTGIHVLPVVGMGGIGKTTIAQMVYNDVRVQERYDLTGWVHVSQTFDLHRLTCAMAETLVREACGYNELSSVHDFLKEKINAKSVFLVLDDQWDERESCWRNLLSPLKFARTMAILVTTRNKEVARLVQTIKPFFVGQLPEDQGWLLFRRYAFGNRSIDEESSLVQVARKIMQKCSGLPLAIKSIGCLLRSKVDIQTWIEISESEFWEYSDDNDEIFSALRLSFNCLPARLKPYFLLCALYPKGRSFTKDDMIHLWIAHGYIQPTRHKLPEQVASEYFDQLNERSLIETDLELCNDRQLMEKSLAEKVTSEDFDELNESSLIAADLELRNDPRDMEKSLRIPEVEISSGQLLKTDPNFIKSQVRSLIESFKTKRSSDQSHSPSQLFRLHDMIWDLAKSLSSHILSVTDYNTESRLKTTKIQELTLSIYRVNRQISLEEKRLNSRRRHNVERLNSQLDNLVTMLFDDYSFHSFGTHKLAYLRTLVLHSASCLDRLSSLQNLRHLRYLHVADYRAISPITTNERTLQRMKCLTEKICDLYSLEKLIISTAQEFSIKSCSLISLRYLHLSFQFNDWSRLPFSELRNLDTLCLQNCHGITDFPLCIGNLVNLQRLQLSGIPKIKSLNHDSFRLQNNSNKCQIMKTMFPSLEEIEFDGLSNLLDWHVSQGSDCPKLRNITIRNCNKLENIPYFPSVSELIISNSAVRNLQLSFCNAPSQLQTLDIRNCQKLSSLMGLENLRSLGSLYVAQCPRLIVSPKRKLLYKPHHVFIDDCPGLMYWCYGQKLHYQHPKIAKLSNLKRAKVFGIAYFHSLKHLSVDICPEKGPELILSPNNWLPSELRLLKFHGGLSTLHKLEIKGCPKLLALLNLEELFVLNSLVIADCPLLYLLPEMKFPPRMSSLMIQGCHKLHSLQLLNLSDPSTFIELEVSDCQGLLYIRGLGHLRKLESLVLLHCLLLQIQEPLQRIPEFVVVFLCPKLKKWCERQSIEYQESLPDSSRELDA